MNKNKIHQIVFIALMTAVICVISPFSVPVGPVPVSFGILAIYFALYALGMKRGLLCVVLYLLLGFIGVPVFTGFVGGVGKVLGPTGGYMLGYIFLAIIAGFFIDKFKKWYFSFIGMILGMMVCYAFGTAWLMYQSHMTALQALWAGVIPFILFDLAKIAVAVIAGPKIRSAVSRVNF